MFKRLREATRHAFALPEATPLNETQAALLDRLAAGVRQRQMEGPAIVAIESSRPLGGLAANLMHALAPFLVGVVSESDLDAATELLAHPLAADELVRRLEEDTAADPNDAPS